MAESASILISIMYFYYFLDLEFLLRSHCQKLRVLEKLHGNAHLLIPKVEGCSTSLAMRVYHECDVSSSSNNTHNNFDTDCLQHFFQSFQLAVVFFILPTGKTQQAQLDDPNSSFHCAQRLADMESTNPSSVCPFANLNVSIRTCVKCTT